MDGRFDLSYLYARLCGSLRSSWLGPRSGELLKAPKVADLWRTIFDDSPPSLPERKLVAALESRVLAESMESFVALAGSLAGAEDFVLALRRKREFARIKGILLALREGRETCPATEDPGLVDDFDPGAWPRIEDMFGSDRFKWLDASALLDLPATENRLDRQYYDEIWAAILGLDPKYRQGAERLFLLEVELKNILWALRLSVYYGLKAEDIRPLLISLPARECQKRALEALERSPGARSAWKGWTYESLLDSGGEGWRLGLPGLEKRMKALLCRKARLVLHLNSTSCGPLYAWFILKEAEAALIMGVAEGLALQVPAEEMLAFVQAGRLS